MCACLYDYALHVDSLFSSVFLFFSSRNSLFFLFIHFILCICFTCSLRILVTDSNHSNAFNISWILVYALETPMCQVPSMLRLLNTEWKKFNKNICGIQFHDTIYTQKCLTKVVSFGFFFASFFFVFVFAVVWNNNNEILHASCTPNAQLLW